MRDRVAGQLAGPGYHISVSGKLVIESKAEMARRGVASCPDDADTLALTFARPVAPLEEPKRMLPPRFYTIQDYGPYA